MDMFHVASSKQSVSKRTQEESNPLAALSPQGDNALWHTTADENINYNIKQGLVQVGAQPLRDVVTM